MADFIGNVNLMPGTVTVDEADHVVVQCADCTHHVAHGITGSKGMEVTVALRPEKIQLATSPPEYTQHNCVRGTVKEKAYFGSFTVYRLQLASGALLKVSEINTARHRDHEATWGDEVWASWSGSAQVVLTQ